MAHQYAATHRRTNAILLLILTLTPLVFSGTFTNENSTSKDMVVTNSVSTIHEEDAWTNSSILTTTPETVTRKILRFQSTASEYSEDDSSFTSTTSTSPQSREVQDTGTISSRVNFTEKATRSETDILECLSANGRLQYATLEVDIRYTQAKSAGVEKGQDEQQLSCIVFVTVPRDMVLHMQFVDVDFSCSNENYVHLYDGREDSYSRDVVVDGCEVVNDAYSTGNAAFFDIRIGRTDVEFSIHLTLTAVPRTRKPQLELEFTSPDQGMQSVCLFL